MFVKRCICFILSLSIFSSYHFVGQLMAQVPNDHDKKERRIYINRAGGNLQVHILGEVQSPGLYRVFPSTRVTELIALAGGLSPKGSQRQIQLRKANASGVQYLDLYRYQRYADLNQNPFLLENDTIFIPLKKRVVQLNGTFHKAGDYELKHESNLADLIDSIGGFSSGYTKTQPIRVLRFASNGIKHIYEVENRNRELSQFRIKNGDVIVSPNVLTAANEFDYDVNQLPNDPIHYPSFDKRVFMVGALNKPGALAFNQNFDLHHYLSMAGGPRIDAKRHVTVLRRNGERIKLRQKKFAGFRVNPGDTILVPEKKFTEQYLISLFTTMATLGLSVYAITR